MNLVLFKESEIDQPLPLDDKRAKHLLDILRVKEGDTFDAGIVNSARGTCTVTEITKEGIRLSFEWGAPPPELMPITLILGYVRPVNAQRIIRDITTLGVSKIILTVSEKVDLSYTTSRLYEMDNIERLLIEGAQQAFCTRLPELVKVKSLTEAMGHIPPNANHIALDNYEATQSLSHYNYRYAHTVLSIGPERGWTEKDRNTLRSHHFELCSLGSRVIRSESACTIAIAFALAGHDLM